MHSGIGCCLDHSLPKSPPFDEDTSSSTTQRASRKGWRRFFSPVCLVPRWLFVRAFCFVLFWNRNAASYFSLDEHLRHPLGPSSRASASPAWRGVLLVRLCRRPWGMAELATRASTLEFAASPKSTLRKMSCVLDGLFLSCLIADSSWSLSRVRVPGRRVTHRIDDAMGVHFSSDRSRQLRHHGWSLSKDADGHRVEEERGGGTMRFLSDRFNARQLFKTQRLGRVKHLHLQYVGRRRGATRRSVVDFAA